MPSNNSALIAGIGAALTGAGFAVGGPFGAAVGVGLTAAALQADAAHQQQLAMQQRVQAEIARQQEYQKQAKGTFEKSLAESTPVVAKKQIEQGVEERQQRYANAAALPFASATQALGENQPSIVEGARQGARQRTLSLAQAQQGGYSNWDLQQAIKNLRANQDIGLIGSLARQSGDVLPFELEQAQHAGDTEKGIGQILGVVSSLVGAGAGLSAASAATAAGEAIPASAYVYPGVTQGIGALGTGLGGRGSALVSPYSSYVTSPYVR